FVLPHSPGQRPAWMIRSGLFLYDHLARRERLPGSRAVSFPPHPAAAILRPEYRRGFTYADCWVEDSRLVVLNAMDAAARGADIRTRTKLISARREDGFWQAEIENLAERTRETVKARAIVNAAGPWVGEVLNARLGREGAKSVRLVKGSHVIVPRLHEGEFAFILQNPDGRIVFAIPYEQEFTLIGTTDIPYQGDPSDVMIDADETAYLCKSVSRYFNRPVSPDQVVSSYSGVRPLYDDHAANASAVTRDYVLDLDDGCEKPPLLSIFGGKITTYRRLAEHALEKLLPAMESAIGAPWTARAALPGGDIPRGDFEAFLRSLTTRYPLMPSGYLRRLARAYGSRVPLVLGDAREFDDLGEDFGGTLTETEIRYLVRHEWARTAEDILWRRSKLALHVPEDTAMRVEAWLKKEET
ncbi:MAG TPA: glycerol-3-phosphate dehydrogenase, partial [Acetobacteraceae bacterium]|nr:glycerol-3-phosphate dehydrogenase [Acetobacteraceae bacterium]